MKGKEDSISPGLECFFPKMFTVRFDTERLCYKLKFIHSKKCCVPTGC